MDIKTSDELQSIVKALQLMVEIELAMEEFYNTCAYTWKEDAEFWSSIADEEKKHAENITRMKEILLNKPDRFEKNRLFNPAAIKTTIDYIKDNTQKVRQGALKKDRAFFIARDIEQSLIEQKYSDVVKTDDFEYNSLIKETISQTLSHRNHFLKKIAEKKL